MHEFVCSGHWRTKKELSVHPGQLLTDPGLEGGRSPEGTGYAPDGVTARSAESRKKHLKGDRHGPTVRLRSDNLC